MIPRENIKLILAACAVLCTGILVMAVLVVAQDVAAPLLLSVVLGIVFAPTADRIERLGLPRWISVTLLLLTLIAAFSTLAYLAEPYFWQLVDALPAIKWELRALLHDYQGILRDVDQVNDEMTQALTGENGAGNETEADTEAGGRSIPTLTDALFLAPQIAVQALIFLGGLFFFLLTRDNVYRFIARRVGNRRATDVILQRFCSAEETVARYFLTISIINAALGAALAAGLTLIGMPGAVVWGVVAALLNFILYLGPMAVVAGLLLAGVLVFDGALSFAPAALFVALNMTEAQFVTPGLVGRNVSINPFLVFASLCVWMWMWGPLGGVVAIPITVIVVKLFDVLDEEPLPEDAADLTRELPRQSGR